jgi:hypothetical protein
VDFEGCEELCIEMGNGDMGREFWEEALDWD